MNKMLAGKRSVNSVLIPLILVGVMLGAFAPLAMFSNADIDDTAMVLEPKSEVSNVVGSVESYNLYLDEAVSEIGGDGSINTSEPDGGHKEESALGGIEFRSSEMISDLQVFGQGNNNLIELSIYLQFEGSSGSTADITFSLAADGQEFTETVQLDSPCQSTFLQPCVLQLKFTVAMRIMVVDGARKKKSNGLQIIVQSTGKWSFQLM
jgi:hypothetical protein